MTTPGERRIFRIFLQSATALVIFGASIGAAIVSAEDVIDRKGNAPPLRGDVIEVSRTEVILKTRVNKREYRIPANEIERVRWDAEKPPLNQFRNDERIGQFDKAIRGYEAALKDAPLSADNMRADLEFMIARAMAEKAHGEEERVDEAAGRLEKFLAAHSNSFRYFEALKFLARLYMAKPDLAKASATTKQLSEAPWTDFRMEADLLQSRVELARGDPSAALKTLDRVIETDPRTPTEISRRYEALLTKASCLEKQGKFQEAAEVLTRIFEEASESDSRTLAKTCLRLGDCYQAAGRTKEAILAYLRVDVLFAKEKKSHAEALYRLSRLFAQDGKPDKAADAAARLQQSYPRSPWTAKLTATPK